MLKIPFFRLGKWVHPVYGELNITQKIFDQVLVNFKSGVLGQEPFVRIGHDLPTKQVFGDTEALAWIKNIVQEGDVLVAMGEPVNEEVSQLIKEKRYRFASAEYSEHGRNRETGKDVGALLSAIALTNEPFLTKLPEATLLANGGDLFYMDYKETGGNKMEELLKKLAESFKNFVTSSKADQEEMKKQQEAAQKQLADMQKMMTDQVKLAEEKAKLASQARVLAEAEKTAAELVAQGIPPIMVAQWKSLAISEQGRTVVKLADAKGEMQDTTQADAIKNMLLALPKEHRIDMSQKGTQSEPEDKVKLACDADILALGGEVTADGKYRI